MNKIRRAIRDLLEEYPLEIGVSLVLITVGIYQTMPPYPETSPLGSHWEAFAVVLGASLALSGVLTIVGLIRWVITASAGIEQLGFWLGAGGVFTHIWVVMITSDPSLSSYLMHIFIGLAFLTRAQGIRRKHRQQRIELELTSELRKEVGRHAPRARGTG